MTAAPAPPPGWPTPDTVARYLELAAQARRGMLGALALVSWVGQAYEVTLLHGGSLDTTLALPAAGPEALWPALDDVAAACPAVDTPVPGAGGRGLAFVVDWPLRTRSLTPPVGQRLARPPRAG